jgi:hypothetical protein
LPGSNARACRRHFIGIGYVLHCEEHFWQMRLLVFVRGEHAPYASAPDVAHKGCGIGDTLGNKGAIGAAFRVHGTTLCFVCCHLEAFQGEVFGRNSDFSQVVSHHRAPSREIPPVAPELPRVARLTPSASGARTSMRCISSTTSSGLVT